MGSELLKSDFYFELPQELIAQDPLEENLRRLAACLPPDRVQIRIPRIPGYNTEENIRKSLDKLKRMGFTRLEVFHYILQKS